MNLGKTAGRTRFFDSVYESLYDCIKSTELAPWEDAIVNGVAEFLAHSPNGHLPDWITALENLTHAQASQTDLATESISIGKSTDLPAAQAEEVADSLRSLHPWRKGPWNYFGIEIDSEWRSNLKWDRLKGAISPLRNRLVLDIGSGNGYYCYRIAGEGARLTLGIDPYLLYVVQSLAPRACVTEPIPAWVVPFGIEQLPARIPVFDTVFSMGTLYHRRSPIDHLLEIRELLAPRGEIVLETLVIDGPEGATLMPNGRYAKMRNTWFIPSCLTLENWLQRCQYRDIRLVDVSPTTSNEQRSTEWMRFDSLDTFLDPADETKTVEGYPGPKRAIFIARK